MSATITEVRTRRGAVPGLGQRVRFARELRSWSQGDLALEMGSDRREVSRWELETSTPGALALLGLSSVLEVSVDWLLTGTGGRLGD